MKSITPEKQFIKDIADANGESIEAALIRVQDFGEKLKQLQNELLHKNQRGNKAEVTQQRKGSQKPE